LKWVWDVLSEQYVRNSQGDVEIWEGRKANYKRVDQSTTLIRAELKALLEREDLPESTRVAASKIVVSYVKYHQEQVHISERLVSGAMATLRAAKG
jgi:hypothetical protein